MKHNISRFFTNSLKILIGWALLKFQSTDGILSEKTNQSLLLNPILCIDHNVLSKLCRDRKLISCNEL